MYSYNLNKITHFTDIIYYFGSDATFLFDMKTQNDYLNCDKSYTFRLEHLNKSEKGK